MADSSNGSGRLDSYELSELLGYIQVIAMMQKTDEEKASWAELMVLVGMSLANNQPNLTEDARGYCKFVRGQNLDELVAALIENLASAKEAVKAAEEKV